MLPFFTQPVLHLGPVTIHAFGIVIAFAVYMGLALAHRRFQQRGLDVATGERMGAWILVGALLGAHFFSVLLYFPDKIASDPWLLLRIWEDISSFGGMIGGLAAAVLYLWFRMDKNRASERWAYLDVVVFVFPFAFAIGRAGCSLAHDHPGTLTHFPLAFSLNSDAARDYITRVYYDAGRSLPVDAALSTMGFNDLGWYEFLYLSIVVVPTLLFFDRRPRVSGFNLFAFGVLYFPVRFAFDLLRVTDVRYIGLTPGQWAAIVGLAAMPWVWRGMKRRSVWMANIPDTAGGVAPA